MSRTPWQEKIILFLIFIYLCGFAIIGPAFAKLGIPLSTNSVNSGGGHAKIFLTEMLLLITASTAAIRIFPGIRSGFGFSWPSPLLLLITIFLIVSLGRIASEIGGAPVTVLRNSAFSWYLALPICLYFTRISARQLDFAIKAALLMTFAYFCISLMRSFFMNDISILQSAWIPEYGSGLILFLCVTATRAFWWPIPPALSGIAIGFAFSDKLQRTYLITLLASIGLITLSLKRLSIPKWRLFRLTLIPAFIPAGILLFSARPLLDKYMIHIDTPAQVSSDGTAPPGFSMKVDLNPLNKAETGSSGIENFRESMWRDAFNLIEQYPLTGIGFERQVVTRIYAGGGKFKPNTGGFEARGTAPVAGPHNSYLNAAARLGVPMGLILFTIHCAALMVLYRKAYWPSFFCLLGQIIYAFFNVGLEGPVRSLGLITCLAVAIKLIEENEAPALRQETH